MESSCHYKSKTTYSDVEFEKVANTASQLHHVYLKGHSSSQLGFDSGLGSMPTNGLLQQASIVQPPQPPSLILPEDSGMYSMGEPSGEEVEKDYAADTTMIVDATEMVQSHEQLEKSMSSMTITNTSNVQEQEGRTVSPKRRREMQQKSRPRFRTPQTNYYSRSRNNNGGPQSLVSERTNVSHEAANRTTTQAHSLPQSWETSGYVSGTNSSLSTVELFSGDSSSGEMATCQWPSIDIFELSKNIQHFIPNYEDGDTGFHLSVIHGDNDLMDKLLFIMSRENRLRAVVNEQNKLYQTALHLSVHTQQTEMIRKLLIAGASLNISDHKGNTPLHISAQFSSTKCLDEIVRYVSVQTVLEVASMKNNLGLTCIHIAAKNGNRDTLRKFKSLGVDIDMQDLNCGKTALHMAVENGSLSDVQFLVETCRAKVNSVTYTGCSPLHIASGRGDIILTAYLLSMGANPELTTDEGDTALDMAGSDQVMTLLTKAASLKWLI